MMEEFTNFIHREIARALDRRTRETVGIVDSYDPQTHAVKVKLQPEGYLTGWLPLRQSHAGNGYGDHVAPNINDHVSIAFHEDDRDAGTVIGAFFNDQSMPLQVQAGERKFQTKFGSWFYFKNDGSFEVQDKAGASYKADGSGNITFTGKAGQTIVMDANGSIILTPAGSGQILLGGSDASRPVSAQGTVDSKGGIDASNLATKVMLK